MADKKISELNLVSLPLSGTEEIPIVQNGETVKVNVGNLRADTSEFVKDRRFSRIDRCIKYCNR